mmetsp:Transcript_8837/g.14339  ORF Transcript_8837/g.14339 Transcript_8837/m.14339 type:complete len:128 (-) Transcript_8837:169-552(-)
MYRTSLKNQQSGPFQGNLVVSMRPYKESQIEEVNQITKSYPGAHGGPIHWGNPDALGIGDIHDPDYGDVTHINNDEVPVFWACGVTPQTALEAAKLPIAITHAPGHMFIADVRDEEMRLDFNSNATE